ncbi:MAG: serine/threonine-protein kinase [Elainellaceae cyanobacterium]
MTRNSHSSNGSAADASDSDAVIVEKSKDETAVKNSTQPVFTDLPKRFWRHGRTFLLRGQTWLAPVGFGHLLMGTWAAVGAIATVTSVGLVEILERQSQAMFFQIRGAESPPEEIVILAIDEPSLDQGEFYSDEPEIYGEMAPLASWPWQRRAYATAIQRLIDAGAKSVALDLVFDAPSNAIDDQQLLEAFQMADGRVTIAASYEDQVLAGGQGTSTQLIEPDPIFRTGDVEIGYINFWRDLNGKIHRLSGDFPLMFAQLYPEQAEYFRRLSQEVPSFDEASLASAQIEVASPKGHNIYYYGGSGTFPRISFWTVIDSEAWDQYLNDQFFQDKIVLIGPTATLFQDMHDTPMGMMPGVEVHANAVATLLSDRAIAEVFPNLYVRGLFVFGVTVVAGVLISRPSHTTHRVLHGLAACAVWFGVGYAVFVGTKQILPTAVPISLIGLCTASYVVTGLAREKLHKIQLRSALKQYASSPIIQEIISQQDDLRDLLQERDQEILGKLLVGRYQLVEVLGSGGFGETYIATDLQRPGNPLCVVKQLRPITNDLKLLKLSKRLFQKEAETLERLGRHNQIPQLLAYFEEGHEFYLVQEFIDGHPLRQELLLGKALPERKVLEMLTELLRILEFIHGYGVIHRDIKPGNVIRRRSDDKLVLIDFGAVKEIQSQLLDDQDVEAHTVGIGTRGYMPSEQAAGTPRLSSDIYAVGVLGIQAVTGQPPDRLPEDPKTGEFIWQGKASISPELETVLSMMTCYSFRDRYQSANDVLEDLAVLLERHGIQESYTPQDLEFDDFGDRPITLVDRLSMDQWKDADVDEEDDCDFDAETMPWQGEIEAEIDIGPATVSDTLNSEPKDSDISTGQ